MKQFIGTCESNPFATVEELSLLIDKARPLSRNRFLIECSLPDDIRDQMLEFPNSFIYYQMKNIWFYEWSRIEHFYK